MFPSFSAGWKFSEEPFIKNLNFISFGKLRAAYGETGANAPADYAYYASVHTALDAYNYPLDYSDIPHPGGVLARIPNREMHWETMVMTNFGIDLGFFNNTLSITADYFNKENDGMLIYQTLPGVAGMYQYAEHVTVLGGDARPISNIGKIVNKGAEFTVGYKKVIGELKASASVNFSFIENEVIDIKGDSIYSGTVHVNLTELCLTTEGYPVSQFNGYVTDGLFTWDDADINDKGEVYVWNQTTFISPSGRVRFGQAKAKPGDLRYVDANQDSSINDLDKRPIGNPIPKFIMGFSTNLEYKNFDLSMFFEGKFGQKIFNGSKWFLMEQELGWNRHTDVLNQYREPIYDAEGNLLFEGNTNTSLPRLDFKADNANFTTVSDFYVEDGSYLRLKNIQLGYTLPVSITGKAGIERLRIYGAIRNLLTITKYSGFDPEVGSRYDTELRTNNMLELGIDKIGNYPHNRMYTIGINLQF